MAVSYLEDRNLELTQVYKYTSATGFQNALGEASNIYIGGTLDAKIRDQINSLAQSGIMYASNGGPGYGIIWMKASASYYGGFAFSYQGGGFQQFFRNASGYFVYNYIPGE